MFEITFNLYPGKFLQIILFIIQQFPFYFLHLHNVPCLAFGWGGVEYFQHFHGFQLGFYAGLTAFFFGLYSKQKS